MSDINNNNIEPTPSTSPSEIQLTSPSSSSSSSPSEIQLNAKWNGKNFDLSFKPDDTFGSVKQKLAELTRVDPKRQKLIGIVKGKLPNDDERLDSLSLTEKRSFMMMGTPDELSLKEPDFSELPDVVNDLDAEYDETSTTDKDIVNIKKLEEYTKKTEISYINPPRKGKNLLVLDLDYTIFDCKSVAENAMELARPGLHEFLTSVYEDYDIAIWSQTKWTWLEMKLTSLGMLSHPSYRICFALDRTSMFKVQSKDAQGNPWSHEVKALPIIWSHIKDYSAANTIHLDDLGRNFAMNPQSGLKVKAYKNAHVSKNSDDELFHLRRYLKKIANQDFRKLTHKKWKKYLDD